MEIARSRDYELIIDPANPFLIMDMEPLSIYPHAVIQFPIDIQGGVPCIVGIAHSGGSESNFPKHLIDNTERQEIESR